MTEYRKNFSTTEPHGWSWAEVHQSVTSFVPFLELFQKNVPQCKIAKILKISPSTPHNIIKRFRESEGVSVCGGQGRRSKLNAGNLRALGQNCIKNSYDSLLDISVLTQEHFQKSLSMNSVYCGIHKCKFKLNHEWREEERGEGPSSFFSADSSTTCISNGMWLN